MHTHTEITSEKRKSSWVTALIPVLCLLLVMLIPQRTAVAHEGPPFPIIVDREVGPYLVSVWTDPDIGIGTFFVVLESNPAVTNLSKEIRSIDIGVTPTSGRLEEAVYSAEAQSVSYGARYWVEVQFDRGEMWKVRVILEGEDWSEELFSEVEATPDGSIGPIVILIYAFPFVLVGILWIRAIMVRRQSVEEEN